MLKSSGDDLFFCTDAVASACFGDTMGLPVYDEQHDVLAGLFFTEDVTHELAGPEQFIDPMGGCEDKVLGDPGLNAKVFSYVSCLEYSSALPNTEHTV